MQKEITALAPSTMKIRIIAPPERTVNTPCGSVFLSLLLYLPPNRCGLANKNMMNLAPQLSTENVSKLKAQFNLSV